MSEEKGKTIKVGIIGQPYLNTAEIAAFARKHDVIEPTYHYPPQLEAAILEEFNTKEVIQQLSVIATPEVVTNSIFPENYSARRERLAKNRKNK